MFLDRKKSKRNHKGKMRNFGDDKEKSASFFVFLLLQGARCAAKFMISDRMSIFVSKDTPET